MPADGEASTEAGTPHALGQDEDVEYWDLSLNEAIHYAALEFAGDA